MQTVGAITIVMLLFFGSILFILLRQILIDQFSKPLVSGQDADVRVYRSRIVKPDVNFSFNEHSAYVSLLLNKDFQVFNNYANRSLSQEERKRVLEAIRVKDLA